MILREARLQTLDRSFGLIRSIWYSGTPLRWIRRRDGKVGIGSLEKPYGQPPSRIIEPRWQRRYDDDDEWES